MNSIFLRIKKTAAAVKESGRREWRQIVVIALLLTMMTCMGGYIDQIGAAAQTAQSIQVSGSGTDMERNGQPALSSPVKNEYEGIIRFHVIANSDTEEGQTLKLRVRNNVLAKIQNQLAAEMAGIENIEEDDQKRAEITRSYIQENLEEIRQWAQESVQAEGYDYPVKASMGVTWIPKKSYDGVYFPAGNYEALNLTIGAGEGHNWWCVIFPPLCLIDSQNELQEDGDELDDNSRLILKFRICELLHQK